MITLILVAAAFGAGYVVGAKKVPAIIAAVKVQLAKIRGK